MKLTPDAVTAERDRLRARADRVVPLANAVRDDLAGIFDTSLPGISDDEYRAAIDDVFADDARAVNVAALSMTLRDLDVAGDYPGFVVDELLGRELAAMVGGDQPLRLLAEATFHYADLRSHGTDGDVAGADDLDAALAAGVQTRLPGWSWREEGFG